MDGQKTKIMLAITKGFWGGAQRYVFDLATNLDPEKYDAAVICGEGNELIERLQQKNIRTFQLKNTKRDISAMADMRSFFDLVKILRAEKPDVLHLNSSKMGFLGALAGRAANVPKIIFTAHGFVFNEDRNIFSKFFIWILSWITVLLCHRIIVINEKEKQQTLAMPFVSPKKIVLIYNGVEKTDFLEKEMARAALATLSKRHFDNKEIWIGTISELHKNKGLKFAIEAMKNIDLPFKFFIIGGGEEKENLQNLIKKNNLEEKIILTGFLPDAERFLPGFDIFLLTSLKEGLPYTILEAGLAGLPVIASNVGGIPEIITNDVSGILVEAGNIDQIAKSLKNLVLEPQKRDPLGTNLKQKVEKDFSLHKMISETEEIYTK